MEDQPRANMMIPHHDSGSVAFVNEMGREGYTGPPVVTNLPLETMADKAAIVNALHGEYVPLEEAEGEVLLLIGFIAARTLFTPMGSEVEETAVKVTLMTDDGRRVFAIGRSAVECCCSIINAFGQDDWNPPIGAVFTRKKTRQGMTWWTVEVQAS